jgi:drug/metabolite transporter (DMT)-like permease
MNPVRTTLYTTLAMIAFAANSLFCRAALKHTAIDAASFTSVRLMFGAVMLYIIASMNRNKVRGNWISALMLFVYAAGFSFAYVRLSAATGALLLFGAVQTTMIGYGILQGERFKKMQAVGLMFALAGLVILLLPGVTTPPPKASILMLIAGIAWGIYSLKGRGKGDPIGMTAGNFLYALPAAAALSLWMHESASIDKAGFLYAAASGALASGLGYAVWYTVLPMLKATKAATVQLSVPVIAALGGIAFLGEPLSLRLVIASAASLGGIALVIMERRR